MDLSHTAESGVEGRELDMIGYNMGMIYCISISYDKVKHFTVWYILFQLTYLSYIDGLVQERHNSIANALELRLSCTDPSILTWKLWNTLIMVNYHSDIQKYILNVQTSMMWHKSINTLSWIRSLSSAKMIHRKLLPRLSGTCPFIVCWVLHTASPSGQLTCMDLLYTAESGVGGRELDMIGYNLWMIYCISINLFIIRTWIFMEHTDHGP